MAGQGFVTKSTEALFSASSYPWRQSQKSCSWELPAAGVTPLDKKEQEKGLGRGGDVWS